MAQARGSWQNFFQSCLVIGLLLWALLTSVLLAIYWLRPAPTPTPAPTAPSAPTVAPLAIGITVEAPPTLTDTPAPTMTFTPVPLPSPPTDTPVPPTPIPSYDLTTTVTSAVTGIEVYLEPQTGAAPLAIIRPEVLPRLSIKVQTTDLNWLQVCCLLGAARPDLWIKNDPNTIKILRPESLRSAQQMLPPPPATATPMPTHFAIEAGLEYYPTNNGILTIFVKVFQGPASSQVPLAGYMLKVRFKEAGQAEFKDRLESNLGAAVSQSAFSPFKNTVHVYNLKYEYDPGSPPEGKKKEEILGTGQWEIWLTNAQGHELSERKYFETNPQNPNREIFISYGLVR